MSITVNTHLDFSDGQINDGTVTLRDAIEQATDGETIDFAPSLNVATITLSHVLGELPIDRNLTFDASGLDNLTIDANDPTPGHKGDGSRVFNISGGDVTLKNLTLTGGDADTNGGAIHATGASLTIQDCLLTGNSAQQEGGADYNGVADRRDFLLWQRQYTGNLNSLAAPVAVPEPSGASLALVAVLGTLMRRRAKSAAWSG